MRFKSTAKFLVVSTVLLTNIVSPNAMSNSESSRLPFSESVKQVNTVKEITGKMPDISLDYDISVRDALNNPKFSGKIKSNINTIANAHGMSSEELKKIAKQDKSLKFDKNARLFYECPTQENLASEGLSSDGHVEQAETMSPTVESAPIDNNYTPDQTFKLHSRPSATKKIFLDFDGAEISGTAWNATKNLPTISIPYYDIDGNTTSFSSTEHINIQEIWKSVSEDYAAFDVDVTTEDPGQTVLASGKAVRACIGGNNTWYSTGAAGVGYVGIFGRTGTYYQPAFVFPPQLGNGNPKYVVEATSHELGHNLGLYHDGKTDGAGTVVGEYYSGHGSWSPIMGGSYNRDITQFSKGEYINASTTQDDLAIISGKLGYSVDESGDSISSSALIPAGTIDVSGIISQSTDIDVFKFYSEAGILNINALGVSPISSSSSIGAAKMTRSNVNLQLTLYDKDGNQLAIDNLANNIDISPNSSITYSISTPDTYYIKVDSIGIGDPSVNGFTDYAAVGNYRLTGTIPQVTSNLPPVAIATADKTSGTAPVAVGFTGSTSHDSDGSILQYNWNFGDGTSSTLSTANPSKIYTTAGTYTATLTVVDNGGLSASSNVTITVVAAPVTNPDLFVSSITMSTSTVKKLGKAIAVVDLLDSNGKPVANASVTGQWSSAITGTSTLTTSSSGAVTFTSGVFKSGTAVFTVTNVIASGYTYNSSLNKESSDSITR